MSCLTICPYSSYVLKYEFKYTESCLCVAKIIFGSAQSAVIGKLRKWLGECSEQLELVWPFEEKFSYLPFVGKGAIAVNQIPFQMLVFCIVCVFWYDVTLEKCSSNLIIYTCACELFVHSKKGDVIWCGNWTCVTQKILLSTHFQAWPLIKQPDLKPTTHNIVMGSLIRIRVIWIFKTNEKNFKQLSSRFISFC